MKTQRIGLSSLETPSIALGCMRMADKSIEEAAIIIQTALDHGINYFDHADIYGAGKSETIFAQALKTLDVKREDIILQSKVGIRPDKGMFDFSYEHIMNATNGILERLETDYLDVLLLHRPDGFMDPQDTAKALIKLRDSKKVKNFGVSNFHPMQIELLQKYLPFPLIANQIQLSIMNTRLFDEGFNVNMHNDASIVRTSGLLEYAQLKDITLQAWSPFLYGHFEGNFIDNPKFPELNKAMGELATKYNVSNTTIATAWILSHPANIQVIAGSMTPSRIIEISKAGAVTLTREEWYYIYRSAGNQLP